MTNSDSAKTALVTGANSGVGLELTKRLLSEGWNVIALIRSDFTNDDASINQARAEHRLHVYRADLSDFKQLKVALQAIRSSESHIDVLFNNAAVAVRGIEQSPQEREMHYEMNTVVPYIIAQELRPLLAKGTGKTIINTSSNALLFIKKFDLELLKHPHIYKPITGPYGVSKLALSLWTQALAPALVQDGIEIRSVCPGPNSTKMTNAPGFPKLLALLRPFLFKHPSVGAARVYDVASMKWHGQSGIFVNKGKATSLRFPSYAAAVLADVNAIYKHEFRI